MIAFFSFTCIEIVLIDPLPRSSLWLITSLLFIGTCVHACVIKCRIYDIQVILKIYIKKKKAYDIQVISVLINLFVVRFSSFILNFDEDIVSIMSQQFFHFFPETAWPNCFWDRLEPKVQQNCNCISWSEFVSTYVVLDFCFSFAFSVRDI